jgi:DNA-binding FadR family transcriptional regulator
MKVQTSPTLMKLRQYLAELELPLNGRLPTERELAERFGVSRSKVRSAMDVLEDEGRVWRHVGRGTFAGARPVLNLEHVSYLNSITSPARIVEARLSLEPQIARLAALNRQPSDVTEMQACNRRCRKARDWRVYEAWDNKFHHSVAAATHNKVLIVLFETLNAVRRAPSWKKITTGDQPTINHPSFSEHDAIARAIATHDGDAAEAHMRTHLMSIRNRMEARAQAEKAAAST